MKNASSLRDEIQARAIVVAFLTMALVVMWVVFVTFFDRFLWVCAPFSAYVALTVVGNVMRIVQCHRQLAPRWPK